MALQNNVGVPPQYVQDTSMVVKFANWLGSKGTVQDSTGAEIYQIEYHTRSPQVRFKEGANGSHQLQQELEFGSATFHTFRSRIDITFRDFPPFIMKCTKLLKGHYSYASPSFNGQTLTWKSSSSWTSFDYVCENEYGQTLAKFAARSMTIDSKKIGGLHFDETLIADGVDQATARLRREEILVLGSSLVYWIKLTLTSAVGGAS